MGNDQRQTLIKSAGQFNILRNAHMTSATFYQPTNHNEEEEPQVLSIHANEHNNTTRTTFTMKKMQLSALPFFLPVERLVLLDSAYQEEQRHLKSTTITTINKKSSYQTGQCCDVNKMSVTNSAYFIFSTKCALRRLFLHKRKIKSIKHRYWPQKDHIRRSLSYICIFLCMCGL